MRKRIGLARSASIGWPLPSVDAEAIEARALGFGKLPVDEAGEWQEWFSARYGMQLPLPDKVAWLFVPSQRPPAIDDGEDGEGLAW